MTITITYWCTLRLHMCNTCVHYHHILVHIAVTLYMVMVKILSLGVLLLTPLTSDRLLYCNITQNFINTRTIKQSNWPRNEFYILKILCYFFEYPAQRFLFYKFKIKFQQCLLWQASVNLFKSATNVGKSLFIRQFPFCNLRRVMRCAQLISEPTV